MKFWNWGPTTIWHNMMTCDQNCFQKSLHPSVHCPLPKPHYTLSTAHCPLHSVHCSLSIACRPMHSAHCPVPTVHCTFPTPLPTVHCTLSTPHGLLPIAPCPLPTIHSPQSIAYAYCPVSTIHPVPTVPYPLPTVQRVRGWGGAAPLVVVATHLL